jgi:membrane associated rhomboid family serine protease
MIIPLYDDNPHRRISQAYVNWSLVATNVLVFFFFQSGYVPGTFVADTAGFTYSYGTIPVVLFQKMNLPVEYIRVPEWLTPITSAFVHGSWMHLTGNMLFLWVFGDNVEDDLGHFKYLLFYLACAVLSTFAYALTAPDSTSPLIGASGAISGVVAAYVLLHPNVKIWVLVLFRIPLKLPAYWAIGAWILYQAYFAIYAWFMTNSTDDVAWFAHIGGLIAGAVLVLPLKSSDAPLFDRSPPPAKNDWRDTFD